MTDRELLELAAKAAGLQYEHGIGLRTDPEFNEYVRWNPLDDDGDALRLQVKLQLTVQCSYASVWVESAIPKLEVVENHRNIDPYAATRRAIVRAAAEIGKER